MAGSYRATAAGAGCGGAGKIRGSTAMPIDPALLEILACPACHTAVRPVKDGTALKCARCHRVYPVRDDIPVMLVDEATIEP